MSEVDVEQRGGDVVRLVLEERRRSSGDDLLGGGSGRDVGRKGVGYERSGVERGSGDVGCIRDS